MTPFLATVGGIVLCGGHSKRMGKPKAWLPCGPEVLLQRMVRLVGGGVSPVVVAARPNQPLPSLPDDIEVVHDQVDNAGPLAGLAAGFDPLAGRCEAVFVCSCDHPLIQPAFIQRLIELLAHHPAVIPEHQRYRYPLIAVYRLTTRPLLSQMLAEGDLRANDFAERCGAKVVSAAELIDVDPNLDSLKNLNDPETYARVAAAMPD